MKLKPSEPADSLVDAMPEKGLYRPAHVRNSLIGAIGVITLVAAIWCGVDVPSWVPFVGRSSTSCVKLSLEAFRGRHKISFAEGNSESLVLTRDDLSLFKGHMSSITCNPKDGPEESASLDPPLLLLVVLGEVYDVTSGSQYYAAPTPAVIDAAPSHLKGSLGYHVFVGQDSSASFATGDFTNPPKEDVRGLTTAQLRSVFEWRDFYRKHQTYQRVGVVTGLYYDPRGSPTRVLTDLEESLVVARGAQQQEDAFLSQLPTCDSSYIPSQKLATVWCPASSEAGEGSRPARTPRKIRWNSNSGEGLKERCACLSAADEERLVRHLEGDIAGLHDRGSAPVHTLQWSTYEGCDVVEAGEACRLPVQ